MFNIIKNKYLSRKRFGQNFLIDKIVVDNIVNIINPQSNQLIIEIGPGFGVLTEAVVNLIDKLIVIEIDRDLAMRLNTHMHLKDKLIIIQNDVMKIDFSLFVKQTCDFIRVFGNLPYNISTPLMFHLFSFSHFIIDMVFMLQKEVVNRLIANPGSKDYGRLSVMAQYYCDINKLLDVMPESFIPIPNVDSAIVKLIPRRKKKYFVKNINFLSYITKLAFNQRRKIISNSLNNIINVKELIFLGVDPVARAENISVKEYCKIANYLYNTNLSNTIV
ncbi:Ribosomal RNA small subunit methyltransferase A [Candidatus Providencia siddallii]|uniref:Ribosomal RNA small subunit methyltransferase A n=1 Tax=Candidatus Providencia siddallii TaxID=1715285 RepID=A0A0M6W6S1_9GAMM|nr:Ribosomal RNA small subunit methyltransferase A [Candidatus Providencia siddallii]